jgi:hypothetical protein
MWRVNKICNFRGINYAQTNNKVRLKSCSRFGYKESFHAERATFQGIQAQMKKARLYGSYAILVRQSIDS